MPHLGAFSIYARELCRQLLMFGEEKPGYPFTVSFAGGHKRPHSSNVIRRDREVCFILLSIRAVYGRFSASLVPRRSHHGTTYCPVPTNGGIGSLSRDRPGGPLLSDWWLVFGNRQVRLAHPSELGTILDHPRRHHHHIDHRRASDQSQDRPYAALSQLQGRGVRGLSDCNS